MDTFKRYPTLDLQTYIRLFQWAWRERTNFTLVIPMEHFSELIKHASQSHKIFVRTAQSGMRIIFVIRRENEKEDASPSI